MEKDGVKIFTCICGKTFINGRAYSGHTSRCKTYYESKGRLQDYFIAISNNAASYSKTARIKREKANREKLYLTTKEEINTWLLKDHFCENCGEKLTFYYGSGRFCSQSCANTRHHSSETKSKISYSLKKFEGFRIPVVSERTMLNYYLNPNYCTICGKLLPYDKRNHKTCSKKCLSARFSEMSRKSAVKRSKNEIAFCELCENYFNEVRHNEPIFNGWDADVIIEDIKYAILWNGPWHYKKVVKTHSLEQVQNRDRLKLIEIEKCGYTSYIIKDPGNYSLKFVREQFNLFINSLTSQ